MKNIKWSNILKEVSVLLIVATMILSTIVVTANTNANKNTLTLYTTATNTVKDNIGNILNGNKVNTDMQKTQFGYYGGSSWHDGNTLSRTQGTAYNFQEIDESDGKSDNSRFRKYMNGGTFIESFGRNLQSGVTADRKVKTNNFDYRGTIYVDDDADPSWYDATHVKTIQEGVDNASTGDTVFVYNGTYNENVMVYKNVDLVGESRENVIVDGNGIGTVLNFMADWINVTEFTITGSGSSWGDAGININSNYNTISGITISNTNYGIYLGFMYSNNVILDCTIYNNNEGIFLDYMSLNNNINNCNLYNNTQYGLDFYFQNSNNSVENCSFYNNEYGVSLAYSPDNYFRNNIINTNNYNFMITGWEISQYYQDIDASNMMNGKPMRYLVEESNLEIQDFGYLGLISCNNITAENSDVCGVLLIDTTNSTISNVNSHNTYIGIYLENSPNNNFINCDSYDNFYVGIVLYYSPNCNITNSNFYNNSGYGLLISRAANNNLTSNNIYDNFYDFVILSESLGDYDQDLDPSNTVNGKPIYYLVGQSNLELDETDNIGYLGLISCTNITVKNSDIYGSVIAGTIQSTIFNISSHNNDYGILLFSSSYNDITDCSLSYNHYGIYVRESSNNNLINCDVHDNSLPTHMSGWQGSGIDLHYSSNNNITNCNSYYNTWGIYLSDSPNNNILNCNPYDNSEDGIYLGDSPNSRLRDNNLYNNGFGLGTSSEGIGAFYQDIDASNMMNGKPMRYLVEESNLEIQDFGYLGLISCNNITAKNSEVYSSMIVNTTNSTISNVDCYNIIKGIFILLSSDNTLIDCDFSNNSQCGIFLAKSPGNSIINCTSYENEWWGICGYSSPYSNITNCDIYNNSETGVYLESSPNSSISNCNIYNSLYYGIYISGGWDGPANDNRIIKCNIYNINNNGIYITGGWESSANNNSIISCTSYNNSYGIYIDYGSNNNTIHHNNLINNTQNAYDVNINQWDSGTIGNYWSDYTGVDNDGNGIGDTPYNISGGTSQDRYPLMNPWPNTEITEIKGGLFRISAKIKNNGIIDTNVHWSITLDKGFILLGKQTAGNVTIPAGEEAIVKSKFIFGFGKTAITVKTEDAEKTADARVLLFIIWKV